MELHSQTALIKERIAKHQDSSPTPINEALDQLFKSAQTMMHTTTLLKAEVTKLQEANKVITKRQKKRRKRIQQGGVLTVQEGQNIIQQEEQINEEMRNRSGQRRCGLCSALGHNSRTCKTPK
jgi:signal recognition particle GTPase